MADEYFTNKTGKSIQELLEDAKASAPKGGMYFWTVLDRDGDWSIISRDFKFSGIDGFLRDEDLAQIHPDEPVYHFEKDEWVRLGDLRPYKSARRRFKQLAEEADRKELLRQTKREAEEQRQREEHEAEKERKLKIFWS